MGTLFVGLKCVCLSFIHSFIHSFSDVQCSVRVMRIKMCFRVLTEMPLQKMSEQLMLVLQTASSFSCAKQIPFFLVIFVVKCETDFLTHTHTQTHTHTHMQTRRHTHTHTHTHTPTLTCKHTHTHTHTHTHIHTHTQTHTCTDTHTHTLSHMRAHTHLHSNKHTHPPLRWKTGDSISVRKTEPPPAKSFSEVPVIFPSLSLSVSLSLSL